MRLTGISLILLALVLSGCAVLNPIGSAPEPAPSLSPLSPISPLASASPLGMPESSSGLLLSLERDGGLAGAHDVWHIYADGRVEATSKGKGTVQAQLPDTDVKSVMQSITSAGLMQLDDDYTPANRCCDRFTYKLTVVDGGTSKTITTMDGAQQPTALSNALDAVNNLIQQAGLRP